MITAEDFLQDSIIISHFYHDDFKQMCCLSKDMQKAMIEFAKLHVTEARKQFKIVFSEIDDVYPFERDDKLSDVYPLSNIK